MSKKAYTLLELLMGVGIFCLLFGILFGILVTSRTSWDIGSTLGDVESRTRLAVENMEKELCYTNPGKIEVTDSGRTVTFRVPTGEDASGEIEWGAEAVKDNYIRYAFNGTQIFRRILASDKTTSVGEQRILANDVQSASFSLSSRILTLNLTLQKTAPNGQNISQSLSSKVSFRN